MINERSFACSFPDFWQELLPLLTPSCVHLLNAGNEKQLQDMHGRKLDPVDVSDETSDAAIVSEFAYHLAKEAFQRSLSISDAFYNDSIRDAVQAAAFELVNSYEGSNVFPDARLNSAELNEGLQLATQYESFVQSQGGKERCSFQVPIKGCGFLHSCVADLMIGDYLVEVKTVKRSLAGKDIRQLVIYLALSSVSRPTPWQHAGFFNPRRATFHRFQVHELIGIMSGGKSAIEVYTELLDFTCSSDVQIDSTF